MSDSKNQTLQIAFGRTMGGSSPTPSVVEPVDEKLKFAFEKEAGEIPYNFL